MDHNHSTAGQPDGTMHPNTTLYFGYGSNLWRAQMALRCPHSTYLGVARLPKYRWFIYERGYANIISTGKDEDEVWALVYSLTDDDEARLDVNEGAPVVYQKEMLDVEFWEFWEAEGGEWIDVKRKRVERRVLVYVDHEGRKEGRAKEEYVFRMNKGIDDAVKAGVPIDYVNRVLRPFISENEGHGAEQKAREQAVKFEDGR